ncbi:helix-turn-helix transcriptional regulator [Jeotgalibacillus sp. R-1-5s-1]|uniref:helix-turn-helix domain-containing protein n=1 Tax=Jeotgalibacillus sp. R-1-5s-1 TaxID=2555897 RepID=UPI00141A9793|nr:helix-turn-helix transcriptional regulator [Jeotgalibacillus sp. R-1-5s-1]
MNNLGERIRKLRKERKMTLVDVAGDFMTKGMLSLIENGRSNPSMESLQHIARQLDVDVHFLLEEQASEELQQFIRSLEERIQDSERDLQLDKYKTLLKQLDQEIAEYLKMNLPATYEKGRLLEIGSRVKRGIVQKPTEESKALSQQAAAVYDQLSLFNRAYKVQLDHALDLFLERKYEEALDFLRDKKQHYLSRTVVADPLVQIESDYNEAVYLYAVGKNEEGTALIDELLAFTKRRSIFHQMDDIYRIAAFNSLLTGDEDKFLYYLKKSRQFAEFKESKMEIESAQFIEIHWLNEFKKEHNKALKMLEQIEEKSGGEDPYVYLEKGRAYFGLGEIDNALKELNKLEMPKYSHHPFDLSMLNTAYAYRALCLAHKGQWEEAMKDADLAKSAVKDFPHTPYRDFIYDTWERVHQQSLS